MNAKIKPRKRESSTAIPPGATIKMLIEEINMTQKELAARLDISEKHMTQVIKGAAEISRSLADDLETVLGIDAIFWLNLENSYRESLKKSSDPLIFENEEAIAKEIPYSELAKRGFVEATRKVKEKVINLRKFFAISDLNNIPKVNVAYKKANTKKENKYALLSWIRIAELQAQQIETEKFNKKKLLKEISNIKKLTMKSTENFIDELIDILADCGIALVLSNHLPGTGLHGVTFLNSKKNKLIIQLSVRRKSADIFWFTLFHELGHIINDNTETFEYINCDEEEEALADSIASEVLIPKERYDDFILNYNYKSYIEIMNFSNKLQIHPCIVIGRLKHEQLLDYSVFQDKTPKFIINDEIAS